MKFTKIALVSVIGMTSLVGAAHSTFAEGPSVGNSKAAITFVAGSGPVTPVDPTNPTEPLVPSGPTDPTDPPTGNAGSLTLDYVSSVEFGSNEISNRTEEYSSKSKKPFIQVTDRRGTGDGWSVIAKASKFTNGTTDSLPGAVITFKNGSTVSISNGTSPEVNNTIILNTDGNTTAAVVSAKSGTGLGTWVTRWLGPSPEENDGSLNDNVTLTIPAGSATVGSHDATITWTLTDAPGL
ncbi:sporozoite surface protein 2 [Bacillus sp. AFS002410]|uniref:WxL domain-containing protein n=1 Tax=Bacillus sp. AFS002410 TaxID=2033481 RepID=UPI000BEFCDF0|nr:WxL domain-containing protein [Bacillus sp. AFS002410]PEJ60554.1 sporozoite surface protein 2 [Bacillus sp. AFS002410]